MAFVDCRGIQLSRLLAYFTKRDVFPTPLRVGLFRAPELAGPPREGSVQPGSPCLPVTCRACALPAGSKYGPERAFHPWCTIANRHKQALLYIGLLHPLVCVEESRVRALSPVSSGTPALPPCCEAGAGSGFLLRRGALVAVFAF